jgi:eukaryotic-like serine/threonine-protein kinase
MEKTNNVSWERLSALLDELLDLEAGPRTQRLAVLRSEDPRLADEVGRLLSDRAAIHEQQFLETSVNPLSPAGRSIGGYTLERPLGEGGMGSVWLARRSDGRFEGRAAIKLLNRGLLGEESVECLRREATALARLAHRNITYLIDVGVDADRPYLVLEYVEGEPIDRWCDAQDLDVAARIRLFLQVLEAVSHAHGRMILHRDLKPSNVLVTSEGVVKLLDFGIAKLLEGAGAIAPPSDHTRLHGGPLTPDYAAPEQVLRTELTTATDVYALGVMLYVLLTGRHPTADDAATPFERLRALAERDPVPASEAAWNRRPALARALRGDLDNILAKALKKSLTERYATVDAFAEDLRRHLTDQPVSARADSQTYRLRKFVRRHRLTVAAASVATFALLGGTAGTAWQAIEAGKEREEARLQRDDARYQSRRAEAANDFLNTLLMSDGGPERPALSSIDRLNLGVELLEKQYGADPAFAGRMLIQLGNQFRNATDTQRAVQLMSRAYELGRGNADRELMALALCASQFAQEHAETGERRSEALREAQHLISELPRPSPALKADCLQAEAWEAHKGGDHAMALSRLLAAKGELETGGETHRPSYALILTLLAGLYIDVAQPATALELYDAVRATHERYGRAGTKAHLMILQNRAVALYYLGEVRSALAQRLELNRQLRQLEPADAVPVYYSISQARLLVRLGQADAALPFAHAAIDRARHGGNHFMLKHALATLADTHLQLGNLTAAAAAVQEAEALVQRDPERGDSARYIDDVAARLDLARGQTTRARARIESALGAVGYPQRKAVNVTDDLLMTASDVALREGRVDDAEEYARAALRATEGMARGRETSADVGESLLRLADALVAKGDYAAAMPLLQRAGRCLSNGLGEEHVLTQRARTIPGVMVAQRSS